MYTLLFLVVVYYNLFMVMEDGIKQYKRSVFLFSLNYLDNLFFDRFQRFFTVPVPVLNLGTGPVPVPGSWKHLPVRFVRKPGTRKPCL